MNKSINAFWAVGFVIIFLGLQFVSMIVTQLSLYLLHGEWPAELGTVGTIFATALFSILAIALFTIARWAPVSRSYVVTRPWGVVGWCVVAAIGATIPSLFVQELMPAWPEQWQDQIDRAAALMSQIMSTTGGYAVICLLAPVAEELVFRGAALRSLLLWQPQRRWLMIVLSAVLFAVSHMNPAQLLHPLVIGLLLGWMYERTRSVLPGIVFHWANNTVAYLLFHAYPDPDITLTQIVGSHGNALLAVFFSLLIVVPSVYQLNRLLRRSTD